MFNINLNIIKNRRVFEDDYIPPVLPVRRELADELIARYLVRIQSRAAGTDITLIYGIMGRVGIGKTTLARYVAERTAEIASRHGYNVRSIYVNVYYRPTIHEMLNQIGKALNPKIADRGISVYDKLRAISDFIYAQSMRLILVLDEIQMLFKKPGEDVEKLYTLFRLNELFPENVEPGTGVDYILVAQGGTVLSYFKEFLPQVYSQIGEKISLSGYRVADLYEILLQRAQLGLYEGTWDDEILYMIAEYYGVDGKGITWGSARMAIVALRNAAEIAAARGSSRITRQHVSHALSRDVVATIDRATLRSLSKHELLLLLAIAELTMEKGWGTTGEVTRLYEELAVQYGERPRRKTQINEYIRRLSMLELVRAEPSSKGMRGKTTILSIHPDIPADALRGEILVILQGVQGAGRIHY